MAITGNSAYAIAAGGYTGQPAYSAFAIELAIKQSGWENAWLRAAPLLAMIYDGKTNWNKGAWRKGNSVIVPINLGKSTTPVDGVADASELTAITPQPTEGFTQAAYEMSHYRGSIALRNSEQQLINNERGDWYAGVIQQKKDEFIDAIAGDLASTAAASRTAVLGIQQVLSTSNTVGGIAQGTDTDWAANVYASYGTFTMDLLDTGSHAVMNRNGNVDLILFAYAASNDLFAKFKASLGQAERIVDANFKAKYGFISIDYAGMKCAMDGRLTSGVICGLDTRTWGYLGDERPFQMGPDRLPGTDANEIMLTQWASVWNKNPAKNWRATVVS